ncbi:hypothetical protein [Limnoglobus roseus]|uniref:Uncharacterized protein n=1 Tax=Limnoglobus roseus TaxID=2598579 RepID=A0A5C1ACA8_9BACT|nr:hypothetical protein [Limnoglobus roseus]QEL17019.1 hypothetical protein PX52LOC_03995 [Limnoglobus roseus]
MEVTENETGGPTIKLYPGDRLSDVKGWHRKLLTPEIVTIFEDAPRYFQNIADKAPVPEMAEWLNKLLAANDWLLELHKSNWSKGGRASFYWKAEGIVGAEMGPPMTKTYHPTVVGQLFELLGFIDWNGFGGTGGGDFHPPKPAADVRATWMEEGEDVDLECSTCWCYFNGDILIEATAAGG